MIPPFSKEQFFDVFVAYNTTLWPMQVLLLGLAVAAVGAAFRRKAWAGKSIVAILVFLWLWMAIGYHWSFFAEINPAARIFGGFFVLQALLLMSYGFRGSGLSFDPRLDLYGIVGGVLIIYALVVYPIVGTALGHGYPAQPTFGLPCPTTIFTAGVLLWAKPPVPWALIAIPIGWSIVGMTAVRYFGVFEDALLPIAAIAAGVLIMLKNRRYRATSAVVKANI
jgi:hypothetical protein